MDKRTKMIKDLVIGNILRKNNDSSRKRKQEREKFYLLLLLTDSIIYSHNLKNNYTNFKGYILDKRLKLF